jgi:hypothetical protein
MHAYVSVRGGSSGLLLHGFRVRYGSVRVCSRPSHAEVSSANKPAAATAAVVAKCLSMCRLEDPQCLAALHSMQQQAGDGLVTASAASLLWHDVLCCSSSRVGTLASCAWGMY